MKKFLLPILATLCAAGMLASCTDAKESADDFASAISVDKPEVALAGANVVPQIVNVTADGDWLVFAPDWISVEPGFGSGNGKISVSATENIDEYEELNGPRSAKVTIIGSSEKVTATFVVNQAGENGLDISKTYSRVSQASDFEAGKAYLLVAATSNGKYYAATPVPANKSYGYPALTEIEPSEDGSIGRPNGSLGLTIEPSGVEGQYYIKQSDGRYWYNSGTFASYNVSATIDDDADHGFAFTLGFDQDGFAVLKNVKKNKTIYCQAKAEGGGYDEFLGVDADAPAPAGHILPMLYKDSKAPSGEVVSVSDKTVPSTATSVSIPVQSNRTWKVRNHDAWIKSFTKSGEGNGAIEVTFDANTSATDSKVATFMVIGESTYLTVTLTQKPVVTVNLPYEESFNATIGDFYLDEKAGSGIWYENGSYGMTAKGNNAVTESWLVSPRINLAGATHAFLSFDQAANYFTNVDNFKSYTGLYIKELNAAEWTAIEPVNYPAGNSWTYVNTGAIDLAAYVGKTVIIALKYTSDATVSGTWEVKNFKVKTTVLPDLAFEKSSVSVKPSASVTNVASSTVSEGAISYASSNEAVATVDATGKISGVAEGSATITATIAASGIYESTTATCTVNVSNSSVVTITAASGFNVSSYGVSQTYYDATLEGIACKVLQVANYSDIIQWRAAGNSNGTGTIYNTDSLGKIVSIVLNYASKDNNKNITLKVGSAANPAEGTEITASLQGTVATFDCSSANAGYFVLTNGSGAGYVESIVISSE